MRAKPNDQRSESPRSSDSAEATRDAATQRTAESESDEELADEPIMVGGAFLHGDTISTDYASSQVLYGIVFKDENNEPLTIDPKSLILSYKQPAGEPQSLSFAQSQHQEFPFEVKLPTEILTLTAHLVAENLILEKEIDLRLSGLGSTGLTATRNIIEGPLLIGNNQLVRSYNKDCTDGQFKELAKRNPRIRKSLSTSFKTTEESKVRIILAGMCGLSKFDIKSLARVKVTGTTGRFETRAVLQPSRNRLVLRLGKVPADTYTLTISAATTNNNDGLDDFLVGRIVVKSTVVTFPDENFD